MIDTSDNPARVLRQIAESMFGPEMLSAEWLAWIAGQEKRCEELVPFPGPQE